MAEFSGFDHLDVRVPSISLVQPFYDALMPLLGLPRRRFAFVKDDEWTEVDPASAAHNTVEYYEEPQAGRPAHFIGLIENAAAPSTLTRIAFRLPQGSDLEEWAARLKTFGARNVEMSADMEQYPAVFFEDPAGTKLEICAR